MRYWKQQNYNLVYTEIYAPVDGYITNLNVSEGTYVSAGQQLLALVDINSFWIAAYFKENAVKKYGAGFHEFRLRYLGHEDQPFEGIVQSVGWGIFVPDGSSGTSTILLPSVSPTIDWVRLAQRFPVRIRVQGKMSGGPCASAKRLQSQFTAERLALILILNACPLRKQTSKSSLMATP